MKTKVLTAAQIDTLARLLAARIGDDRAARVFSLIMKAATAEQAEARLTLVLDYGNPNPAGEPIDSPVDASKAARAQVVGKRQAVLDQAQTVALPTAPDFSDPTRPAPAPSWLRLSPWRKWATVPVCRLSRSTRSHPAARLWHATATSA